MPVMCLNAWSTGGRVVELLCLLRSRLEAVPTITRFYLWTEEFDEELDFISVMMDEDDIALGA